MPRDSIFYLLRQNKALQEENKKLKEQIEIRDLEIDFIDPNSTEIIFKGHRYYTEKELPKLLAEFLDWRNKKMKSLSLKQFNVWKYLSEESKAEQFLKEKEE